MKKLFFVLAFILMFSTLSFAESFLYIKNLGCYIKIAKKDLIKYKNSSKKDQIYLVNLKIKPKNICKKIDDWNFKIKKPFNKKFSLSSKTLGLRNSLSTESLGLEVGGRKRLENFRLNILNNYLPLEESISSSAIFYDYYFDISSKKKCKKLFCPIYEFAKFKNQDYMRIGLKSNIKINKYKRPQLNLIIVLDISGSMSSPFNEYYYDQFKKNKLNLKELKIKKINVAKKVLKSILNKLRPNDRLAIILFNNQGYLAKPLSYVCNTKLNKLKWHIDHDIFAFGGTNFESGLKVAQNEIKKIPIYERNNKEHETRIIFLTDMMPNLGDYSAQGLFRYLKDFEKEAVHATFVGIGLDFNSQLVQKINQLKGSNTFFVNRPKQFEDILVKEFDYIMFPLIYDLELTIDTSDFYIEKSYGLDNNENHKRLIYVRSLFPSITKNHKAKGSIILLRLKPKTKIKNKKIKFIISYYDRDSQFHEYFKTTKIKFHKPSRSLLKAIILANYVDLMKKWIYYENNKGCIKNQAFDDWKYMPYHSNKRYLNPNELQSTPLCVSKEFCSEFSKMKNDFLFAIQYTRDKSLFREIKLLNHLLSYCN